MLEQSSFSSDLPPFLGAPWPVDSLALSVVSSSPTPPCILPHIACTTASSSPTCTHRMHCSPRTPARLHASNSAPALRAAKSLPCCVSPCSVLTHIHALTAFSFLLCPCCPNCFLINTAEQRLFHCCHLLAAMPRVHFQLRCACPRLSRVPSPVV